MPVEHYPACRFQPHWADPWAKSFKRKPIRPINQVVLQTAVASGWVHSVEASLFRSVFACRHHHHGRRHHHLRGRSRLVVACTSPPPTHLQRHLRFLTAAAAPRHHPRPLRPLPAVASAGGQPQVPQREGGRGRRGRGRGGDPAAVQLAGVPRGRHGGDQAAAEARGRAGQAQAQGAVGGAEVPPEVRSSSICFVDSCV